MSRTQELHHSSWATVLSVLNCSGSHIDVALGKGGLSAPHLCPMKTCDVPLAYGWHVPENINRSKNSNRTCATGAVGYAGGRLLLRVPSAAVKLVRA